MILFFHCKRGARLYSLEVELAAMADEFENDQQELAQTDGKLQHTWNTHTHIYV